MDANLVKVELGCGRTKSEGYIGVDRFKIPGVDIVADMNKRLPFEDNSVDVIYACHSLEHLEDLQHIMSEIYRICKHKSIIYILAPYTFTSLNTANFYHRIQFNEDTFRLFSNEKENAFINKEEYYCPHSYEWGLEQSDNSSGNMEFILLKMEYFYYKEYLNLSDSEKLHARRSLLNVCDQIYYALSINKSNVKFSNQEINELQSFIKKNEPPVINALRNRDAQINESKSLITDIIEKTSKFANENTIKLINSNNIKMKDEIDNCLSIIRNQKQTIDLLIENQKKLTEELQDNKNLLLKNEQSLLLTIENYKKLAKDFCDEFEKTKNDYDNKLNEITLKINCYTYENNSILSTLLELLKSHENKRLSSLYNKRKDLFHILKDIYIDYIDGIVIRNQYFNEKSLLTISHTVPYDKYYEYHISGSGSKIHYFIIANYGANLFVELVKNGNIIKQFNYFVSNEGEQYIELDEQNNGEISVRFRVLDNKSIVRLLELTNRKHILFSDKKLAAYID